jgi:hypothetical protein
MSLHPTVSSPAKAGDPVFQRPSFEPMGRGVLGTRMRGYDTIFALPFERAFKQPLKQRSDNRRSAFMILSPTNL